ncbi:hypothetical protein KUTeg_024798 [Tegillarca granosa]|uniref:TIR domain-containing protein n=1 Tax=Tegillarca granosa TaxID=220873 RepID=A0ABQ9DZ35_TEGGR|nr:hypothetical protein KUTeg_024798 [Tegillarca granosa]
MDNQRCQLDRLNPGLFNLGLNIGSISDKEQLQDVHLYLSTTRKEDPTPTVHNILECMIAYVENKRPLWKRKALKRLESILNDNPHHLNALADIETIYRQMQMNLHAEIYNTRKNEILKSNDPEHIRQKAICLLEQGYCILAEDADGYGEASKYCTAIKKLEYGLSMLKSKHDSDPTECIIWKYYVALAYMRYDRRIRVESTTCLSYFFEVIKYLENFDVEDKSFYIARSYIYIGWISIRDSLEANSINSFSGDFQDILQNPLEACERAYRKSPSDTVVLNRYARCLIKNFRRIENPKDTNDLELAKSLLEKSLTISPESNWGAYTTNIDLCQTWTKSPNIKMDDEETKDFLLRAVEDGKKCSKTKISEKDCVEIADICHRLARFPHKPHLQGVGYVHQEEYLYEASSFLHLGRIKGGKMKYFNSFQMGRCLSDLKEYRTAAEWTKRALYLSTPDKLWGSLQNLCWYLYSLYCIDADQDYLLEEILVLMVYGSSFSTEQTFIERMTKSMMKLCKEQLLSVVVFFNKSQYCTEPLYLNTMQEIKTFLRPNQRGFVEKTVVIPRDDILDEPFANSFSPLPKVELFDDSKKTYDFFLFNSCKDSGWITAHLLRQLEQSFDENEKALRGCVDRRDFQIGKSVIDNICNGISKSRHTLVILSPTFLEHRLNQLHCNSRIRELVEHKQADDEKAVIVVVIQKCTIPESLKQLECIDLTENTNMLQEILKLKSILLS